MKVYTVELGDYSDRKVVAVTSENPTSKFSSNAHITEWELDKVPVGCPPGFYWCAVHMSERGEVTKVDLTTDLDQVPDISSGYVYPWVHILESQSVAFRMFARDEQHAIKIANERRIQLIAAEGWPSKGFPLEYQMTKPHIKALIESWDLWPKVD